MMNYFYNPLENEVPVGKLVCRSVDEVLMLSD